MQPTDLNRQIHSGTFFWSADLFWEQPDILPVEISDLHLYDHLFYLHYDDRLLGTILRHPTNQQEYSSGAGVMIISPTLSSG